MPSLRSLGLLLTALLTASACDGGGSDATAEATRAASPVRTAIATPTPRWPPVARATVTTEDLNVRSGPGASFPVIGRLQPEDVVPVSARLAGAEWLALPGIGWIAYSEDWVRLDIPFKELPQLSEPARAFEFTGPVYPADARSGIPVVDEVLAAFVSRDRTRLLALANAPAPPQATATPTASATAVVTSVPTLVPDVTEAATPTATATARATSCSDSPLPAARLRDFLDAFYRTDIPAASRGGDGQGVLRLYGVVRAPVPATGLPDYVLVLAFEGGDGRQVWVSPDGRITQFTLPCEPALPGSLLRVTSGEPFFWSRPAVQPPVHALP